MKTRATVAVLVATFAFPLFACAVADAQVLGGAGGLTGGLSGSLGGAGGLHNPGGVFRGAADGSFGGDVGFGGVRRGTSELGSRAAQRATGAARAAGSRTRDTANAASATAASSAAAAGEARNSVPNTAQNTAQHNVMGGVAGSLDGGATLIKQPQLAAPSMPSEPTTANTSSGMLDMAAGGQHSTTISGANRETQLMGQGAGSLTGNASEHSVGASAQGNGGATLTRQAPTTQPAQ